jgi:uncharacterized OB-fold protein
VLADVDRPRPVPTPETRPFWAGCADGRLRYQACRDCGAVQKLPHAYCEACHSSALEWRDSARIGRILSHTTVHRAPTPAFRAALPYVIVLVEMNEGFRLLVNLHGGAQPGLAIDAEVEIDFVAVQGTMLPEARIVS